MGKDMRQKLVIIISILFLSILVTYIFSYGIETKIGNFVFKNFICLTVLTITILFLIMIKKNCNLFTKILLSLFCIMIFCCLYLFSNRIDYQIYFIFFLISLIYLIIRIFLSIKNKNIKLLSDGIISIFLPSCLMIIKAVQLSYYIYYKDNNIILIMLIVSLVFALIIAIVYIISYCKKKINCYQTNKEKILKFIACFFYSFIILFLVTLSFIKLINYTFDNSNVLEFDTVVVDKYDKRGTGRGSKTTYYLGVIIDGDYKALQVERYLYESTNEGRIIHIKKCNGALGLEFLEYFVE